MEDGLCEANTMGSNKKKRVAMRVDGIVDERDEGHELAIGNIEMTIPNKDQQDCNCKKRGNEV